MEMKFALDRTRTSGIFDARGFSAVIIGAGGIGAITAITLAKMGIEYLDIYDGDTVEEVNVPTQYHFHGRVGEPKSRAVWEAVGLYAPDCDLTFWSDFEPDTMLAANFIISAVDSIDTRKMIWEALGNSKWLWYLDARMGAEIFGLYAVRHDECAWYSELLAKQDENTVEDLPCTAKATIYTANGAAAFIGAAVRKILTGVEMPRITSVDFLSNQTISAFANGEVT